MIAYYIIGGVILAGIIALLPVGYVLNDVYPYAYSNARIRAKQQTLVDEDDLISYTRRGFEDIIYDLDQNYELNLAKHLSPDLTYAAIDTALRDHHIESVQELKRASPDSHNRFLTTYLSKFKLRIIKNLIRQNNVELAEASKALPRSLQFSLQFRDKEHPSLDEIKNELETTAYKDIFDEHEEAIRQGEYDSFERRLNIEYLHSLFHASPTRTAKRYAQKNIDRLNLSSALKNRDVFADHGVIPADDLRAASTTEDYRSVLNDNGYDDVTVTDDPEQSFNAHLRHHADHLLTRQPLSDNTIIAYLIHKSLNVQNLNILLKLSYHKTSPETIQQELIL